MSQSSTQQTQLQPLAYNAIDNYFTSHSHEIVEIEILPPAFLPSDSLILQDGANLGLPKKILALAFVHARHLFFENRVSAVSEERIIAHKSTRVMLLFDPEHLTAANYRKRHLLYLKEQNNESLVDAMWAEWQFLDSILTSPLHRQTKSPTLWSHRAWLLDYTMPMLLDFGYDVPAFFAKELDAVMNSGERHPKNYYAWQYARRLIFKKPQSLTEDQWTAFRRTSSTKVKQWCCQHPSDISGFSFLAWLLDISNPKHRNEIVKEIIDYATSVQLANESIWVFVRTMLANGSLSHEDSKAHRYRLSECEEQLKNGKEAESFRERLSQTTCWILQKDADNQNEMHKMT